jgi:hypothetical protein
MSTPPGAVVAPNRTVVQGQVIQPTAIVDATSEAIHGFLAVVRKLISASPAFHSEADQDAAYEAINTFARNQVSPSTLAQLLEEHSAPAPKEDVTQRVAPQSGLPQPLMPSAPLDYDKLARAMLAIQQEQAAQSQAPVPTSPPEPN